MFGGTVGYPSDSLASCSVQLWNFCSIWGFFVTRHWDFWKFRVGPLLCNVVQLVGVWVVLHCTLFFAWALGQLNSALGLPPLK